jgi:Kef-type K+ transport system membrane component KefB
VKLLAGKTGIPEVTGYVIAGILCGVILSQFSSRDIIDKLSFIPSIALGIIAFVIGIELKWDLIKKLGKPILAITLFESLGAFFMVFFALLPFYHVP